MKHHLVQEFIILPLNIKLIIFISGIFELNNDDFLFIQKDGDVKVNSINKCICNLEIKYGDGFIFGNDETIIKEYISYIKSAVKTEKQIKHKFKIIGVR